MITAYVVHFDPLGYYSKNQSRYDWAFTKDIDNANVYFTKEAAEKRLEYGIDIARSHLAQPPLRCMYNSEFYKITSGVVDEVQIEIAFSNTVKTLDTVQAPKVSAICPLLWKRIDERMENAQKAGKYSASLNSIADNGQTVRGLGMYLSSAVYNELCDKLKNELGLGIKIDVGPIPNHRVYWSKFNLAQGV